MLSGGKDSEAGGLSCFGNPQEEAVASIPLDEVLSNVGIGWFHTRLMWLCGLGFCASAVEVVLSGFLYMELRKEWHLSEYQIGVIPTMVGVGSFVGELSWGPLADAYGRRTVFTLTCLVSFTFGMGTAFAPNLNWLIFLRCLMGFGHAGFSSVDCTIFTEFYPTEHRGRAQFMLQLFWPVGRLLTGLAAFAILPQYGWRVFVGICALPMLFIAMTRPLIPESPRWLLLNGHVDECTRVCREMAVMNGKSAADVGLPDGTLVTLESSSLHGRNDTTAPSAKFWGIFSPGLRSTTIGLVLVTVCLNASGYWMLTLLPSLLHKKGIKETDIFTNMICSAAASIPGVLIMAYISLRIGKLLPLKTCLLGLGFSIAIFAHATTERDVLISCCFGSMCLEAAWSIRTTYVSEVYPTEIRATALGALDAMSSVLSMCVPLTAAAMLARPDGMQIAMTFFSGLCLFASICAALFFHIETHLRDLEDVVARV